jgi:hypothetical protein
MMGRTIGLKELDSLLVIENEGMLAEVSTTPLGVVCWKMVEQHAEESHDHQASRRA